MDRRGNRAAPVRMVAGRGRACRQMVEATAQGVGREEDAHDRRISVEITYLGDSVASATCLCHRYVDLLDLIRMPEGWRIVSAAWELRVRA